MGIEKVGVVFQEYCLNHRILKVLLPLSMPILLVSAILRVVQTFISLGSVVSVVVFVGYILGILLVFAMSEYQIMAIGIGIYSLGYVITLLRTLISIHMLSWSSALYLVIWAFFAYLAYQKSIQLSAN